MVFSGRQYNLFGDIYLAMQRLNLPKQYEFEFRRQHDKLQILDPFRQRFVVLTPEEWVRQNFAQFLVQELKYPRGHMAIEQTLEYHGSRIRADIVVRQRSGIPLLIVECKAPEINIKQTIFDQLARYNRVLKAQYLVVTNGLLHYCYVIDQNGENHRFVEAIPPY